MTIAEQMREKGRQEGLQEGLQEGRQEGLQEGRLDVLLRQLRVKFGPLTPEVEGRVRAASEATLQGWADGILTAARLEDLLGEAR